MSIIVFIHASIRVKQLVHWTPCAHSAVARARVGGIAHWSFFLVEHNGHFQWSRSEACASCLHTERTVLNRDSEKLSSRTDCCEESRKSSEIEKRRFGREKIRGALIWATRQRRIVVKTCGSSQRDRFIPGSLSLENRPTRTTRSTGSMIPLESSPHTLSFLQQTHPAGSSGTQAKAWLGGLETIAQRVRLHVVHATRGDPSAGSEPSALSTI